MGMVECRNPGARIAEAACARKGWPFRPQGRGREGLDCLGLVLEASAAVGIQLSVPRFAMMGHSRESVLGWMQSLGFREVQLFAALPGDVLVAFPATRQVHLAIRTIGGFVEANARVRRVVEQPWLEGAGWHSAWRLCGEQN